MSWEKGSYHIDPDFGGGLKALGSVEGVTIANVDKAKLENWYRAGIEKKDRKKEIKK